MKRKTVVIGLDCAEPNLVFKRFKQELPTLNKLAAEGFSSTLKSSNPPITIPAWSVLTTGRTAGELGVYGFRNRKNYDYLQSYTADNRAINEKRIWDYLSEQNGKSIVLGVPQTFPINPLNGYLVSGILTPSPKATCTYPVTLKKRMENWVDNYQFDIKNFRNVAPEPFLKELYQMTAKRFVLARKMLKTYPWDFFMMVEIGLDRIQHLFWQYMDENALNYTANHPYKNVIKKYYQFLDTEIAETLKLIEPNTDIWVVSDHGAKAMKSLFHINQWLVEKGWLVVKSKPDNQGSNLSMENVDWQHTKVWADGGYYARIYFNIKGREPAGIIEADKFEAFKIELIESLKSIKGEKGEVWKNKILDPHKIYPKVKGIAPDLLCYFDDLSVRASGKIYLNGKKYSFENDTGPDGANHSEYGLIIGKGTHIKQQEMARTPTLLDVTPTILERMGITYPANFVGRALFKR